MRTIGIRHRVKQTAEGEARPTQVAIRLENGKLKNLELATETDELDFLLGHFPTKWTPLTEEDTLKDRLEHHIRRREVKKEENRDELPQKFLIKAKGGKWRLATHVATEFEGFQAGDTVAMMLGGSGDNLKFALARRGQEIGSEVFHIRPTTFNEKWEKEGLSEKEIGERQAELLVSHLLAMPGDFYEVSPRDLNVIQLREALRARIDAMKARIACEQRLRQRVIGIIFCKPDGRFPEGDVEKQFDDAKANDKIYQALCAEESKRQSELEKACGGLDIYMELFKPVVGMGPLIASRIIGAVIDIRRFYKQPDDQRLAALWVERAEIETRIGLDEKFSLVETLVPARANRYDKTVAVRNLLASQGEHNDLIPALDRIIHIHKERHKVRRKAYTKSKMALRAYCGVHVLPDGRFPRRRNNEIANWAGDCRQALYLLGDQFNRRPASYWGTELIKAKAKYRASHPEPIVSDSKLTHLFRRLEVFFREHGVKIEPADYRVTSIDGLYAWFRASVTELGEKADDLRTEIMTWEGTLDNAQESGKTVKIFTAGHIHKMAIWYTIGKFVEALFRDWDKLSRGKMTPLPTTGPELASEPETELEETMSDESLETDEVAA